MGVGVNGGGAEVEGGSEYDLCRTLIGRCLQHFHVFKEKLCSKFCSIP